MSDNHFISRKTFAMEAAWVRRRWACLLCGVRFKVGDLARWIYTNDGECRWQGGNFFVCDSCDTGEDGDAIEAACAAVEKINPEMWRVLKMCTSVPVRATPEEATDAE